MSRPAPQLDDMLSKEEAAEWLQLRPRDLMEKTKGTSPRIPAFKLNQRVIRFHPRTVIAKMAKDAGVKPEVIAAMFGIYLEKGARP
jgi:hypothetical protein